MRTFWLLVDKWRWVLIIVAFVAPMIGTLIGMLVRERRRERRAENVEQPLRTGFVLGFAALPVLLGMSMCSPPAGRGWDFEQWYAYMQPRIDALAAYHRDVGVYPDSLQQLVPRYLSDSVVTAMPEGARRRIRYFVDSTRSYVLSFEYYGPRVNLCTYRSGDREWRCGER